MAQDDFLNDMYTDFGEDSDSIEELAGFDEEEGAKKPEVELSGKFPEITKRFETVPHQYINDPLKKRMIILSRSVNNIRMAMAIKHRVSHKTQSINTHSINALFPAVVADIIFIRRRIRKAHLEKPRGKNACPPAVKEGPVLQTHRPSSLAVIKNIRPLAYQGESVFIIAVYFFKGFPGDQSET